MKLKKNFTLTINTLGMGIIVKKNNVTLTGSVIMRQLRNN